MEGSGKSLALLAWRADLYRRRIAGRCQGTGWPRRRARDSRDRLGWQIDGRPDRWAQNRRHIGCSWREPGPFPVSTLQLILVRKSIVGWPSGTSIDSED